jgi:hypothetical protein
MLNRDPGQLQNMIASSADGGFDVSFPGTKKTHIPSFTDGEVALSSSAGSSGCWVAVFEAAFGSVKNGIQNPGPKADILTDAIRDGGTMSATIRTLTGHAAKRYALRKPGVKVMPSAERAAARLPVLREAITSALKDRRLAGAGTNTADLPPGISPKHAYTILDFDAASDTVRLWNPHGNRFVPAGEPGLTNGYPTKDGVFSVPLSEFARVFSGMTVETPVTASPAPSLPLKAAVTATGT